MRPDVICWQYWVVYEDGRPSENKFYSGRVMDGQIWQFEISGREGRIYKSKSIAYPKAGFPAKCGTPARILISLHLITDIKVINETPTTSFINSLCKCAYQL